MERQGIYVEIPVRASVERLWALTQDPEQHHRWDLRFTRITYLPRVNDQEPQRFLYETRIGFGLRIHGTGESVGLLSRTGGDTTSSLKFASDDPKSLIRSGSGYWRYIPDVAATRFLTWYDYDVRFGTLGRLIDRFAFRPLMGWATAWSFDRLRLWAEAEQAPEASMTAALMHGLARTTIAAIWIWHGLVPKLIYGSADEIRMLREAGLPPEWAVWIGAAEVLIGLLVLSTWNRPRILLANVPLMFMATIAVALRSPEYLTAAFNPITLNLSVIMLSIMGWLAAKSMPAASRCIRNKPERNS